MRTTATLLIAILALCPLGCSFYYSSESSAKSCTSPSRSSASSSDSSDDDDAKKEAYRNDVRDFTVAWAERQGDLDGFEAGLGDVARRHGVTDWEADDATYAAIGAGLRRAHASDEDVERYAARLRATGARAALVRGDPTS